MIQTTYQRGEHRLTVDGHTMTGEAGHDALCAAVLTLVYTLAAALVDLTAAGEISSPDASLKEGHSVLQCHSSYRSRGAVLLTFDTIARGLALLATRYPKLIQYQET